MPKASVSQPFFHGAIHKAIFYIAKNSYLPTYVIIGQKVRRQSANSWREKNPAILWGIFGILRCVSKFLCIYSMISRGTPDEVVRNFGWETVG